MTTPLIMLLLLVAPYVVLGAAGMMRGREVFDASTRGCLGLTLVFLFTGAGHFAQTEAMAEMLPPWVPARIPLVYVTGVIELAAAIAVLIPRLRRLTGWALAAMLVGFLPVNIYAAVNRVGMGGHVWGPVYLLIRVPLQLILLWWVWRFAVRFQVPR
jgi:uncharacterized membrane protein